MLKIFSSINNWIPQPDRTEARLASGLHVVRQSFVFAGTPTTAPYAEGDSWDGFKVYPQPEITQSSAGIYSSTVTAYSVWQKLQGEVLFDVFEQKTSKILKTGTLFYIKTSTSPEGQPIETTTTYDFEYLAPRVHTRIAAATSTPPTPTQPGQIFSNAITITRTPFLDCVENRSWVLSNFETENFGDFSIFSYTFEVLATLTKDETT